MKREVERLRSLLISTNKNIIEVCDAVEARGLDGAAVPRPSLRRAALH